jgi:hypothetical protein
MGQIQNALNQLFGTMAVASHIGAKAFEPGKELRQARKITKSAGQDAAFYSKEAVKTTQEVRRLIEEGKLDAAEETLNDESLNYEFAQGAEEAEAEAIEEQRKLEMKYGTRKQREAAIKETGDYMANKLTATPANEVVDSLRKSIEEKRGIQQANAERILALTENAPAPYHRKEVIRYGE